MNLNDDLSVHTNLRSVISMKTKEVPDPDSHTSDFGESACGEPLAPQRLVVDFTPNEDDTDFIQKKCCAFWDFITSCPEVESFIVRPEPNISERKSRASDVELAPMKTYEPQADPVKTAVSMIEFVEEKGLITRAFESKLPQSGCSVGSLDYFDEKPTIPHGIKEEVCNCSKVCKTCNVKNSTEKQAKKITEGVQEMCRELQDWDKHHPKSMDPPGHPPALDQP